MRLLHVQKASGIGGSERHLLMLLPALTAAGHDVTMCVAISGDGERFATALEDAGVDVVRMPAGPDLNPRLVARLRGAIRAARPDVVHTHLIHGDVHGLAAARSLGVPAVSSVHDTAARLRREPLRSGAAAVGRLPQATIAISHHVRASLVGCGLRPRDRVDVVHYGIDAGDWAVSAPARARARSRLGLHGDDVAIAMAARLVPGKGHDDAIAALGLALAERPELRLLMAGDGPLRDAITSQARTLPDGIVRMLGFVDDVRPVIAAADALVFPTRPKLGEGFGLAALEAMAAGRPVVATRVGALPEVVDDASGLLVEPGDTAALARAFTHLAGDRRERERLGAAAAERARSDFSVGAMVARTEGVYERALGSPTSAGVRSLRSTSMPTRFGARSRS